MGQVYSGVKKRIEEQGPIDVLYSESSVFDREPMQIIGVELDEKYVSFNLKVQATGAECSVACCRADLMISGDGGCLMFCAPHLWTIRFTQASAQPVVAVAEGLET